jgi:outer membrane protein assembly factor BamE (lipoprotein component of BamABCDE complex)
MHYSLVLTITLSFAALLAGCVSDSERTERPRVRVGMSRDDLRFCFGNPSRIESTASGGEDWYYSFASWSPPQVESSSSVDSSGARTDSVSVSMSDTKTKQECPIHLSSNGYVIEPIPAGTIVGK